METMINLNKFKNIDSSDKPRWREIIDAWESSGESQKQFCARRHLKKNTLSYWRSKLLALKISGRSKSILGFKTREFYSYQNKP